MGHGPLGTTLADSCPINILMHMDSHTLGSAGSLLSSVSLFPYFCTYISLKPLYSVLLSSVLLLIILCGLPSVRSPQLTGGRVARAPLGNASACSVASWIPRLYICCIICIRYSVILQTVILLFCTCNIYCFFSSYWGSKDRGCRSLYRLESRLRQCNFFLAR